MFRPKNPSDTAPRQSRHTLEAWTHTPTLENVRLMMDEAAAKRGVLIDVSIRRDRPPIFVLTCQWEAGSQDPVWCLYEGEDGSKVCWAYPNGNLDMIYEIICMSLPGGVKSSSPSTLGNSTNAAGSAGNERGVGAPPGPPAMPPMPGAGQAMPGSPPHGQPYVHPGQAVPPAQGYPQNPPYPPPAPAYPQGYPQPGNPYPPQPPYPGAMPAYQQPPHGAPPGYPQGYPSGPPGYPPGYPPQQPAYPPGNSYPNPNANPNSLPPQYQQQPQAPLPAPGAASAKPAELNSFIDLLNKGQNQMMLGHLFVEAGVLPEPCVEAALKLQELVRKGLLSNSAAIEALRRAAESGGAMDDEIIAACRSKYPADSLTQGVPVVKPGSMDPREFNRLVLQLIQQSGIVTDNDLATAEGVRKKHGGDVGSILVAAGKIERATLDAAKRCQPLVREHRLNNEEAFRILRHCQKNKSSVDDAFRALSIQVL